MFAKARGRRRNNTVTRQQPVFNFRPESSTEKRVDCREAIALDHLGDALPLVTPLWPEDEISDLALSRVQA
jgi:hypothetical protein